jgi:hypothetical protein
MYYAAEYYRAGNDISQNKNAYDDAPAMLIRRAVKTGAMFDNMLFHPAEQLAAGALTLKKHP